MDFYTFQYHNILIPLLCLGWLLDLFPITGKAFRYSLLTSFSSQTSGSHRASQYVFYMLFI